MFVKVPNIIVERFGIVLLSGIVANVVVEGFRRILFQFFMLFVVKVPNIIVERFGIVLLSGIVILIFLCFGFIQDLLNVFIV